MSDAGGMGMARPEYDPAGDPGNYPLVFLRAQVANVQYHPAHDWFTAYIGATWVCVDRSVLLYIYGLSRFHRAGALVPAVELAVIDYFQHEALFRSLTPAEEV